MWYIHVYEILVDYRVAIHRHGKESTNVVDNSLNFFNNDELGDVRGNKCRLVFSDDILQNGSGLG